MTIETEEKETTKKNSTAQMLSFMQNTALEGLFFTGAMLLAGSVSPVKWRTLTVISGISYAASNLLLMYSHKYKKDNKLDANDQELAVHYFHSPV